MDKRKRIYKGDDLASFDVVWAEHEGRSGVAVIESRFFDHLKEATFFLIENVRRPGLSLFDTMPSGTKFYEATDDDKKHACNLFIEQFGPSGFGFTDELNKPEDLTNCLRDKFADLTKSLLLRHTKYDIESSYHYLDYQDWQLRPVLGMVMDFVTYYERQKYEARICLADKNELIESLQEQLNPTTSKP